MGCAVIALARMQRMSLAAAELCLAALTLAAAAGLGSVLEGPWLGPVVVAVVVAHATAAGLRRWGRPLWQAVPLTGAVGALTAVWLAVPESTVAGIPTTATPAAMASALEQAWATFRGEVAPVATEPGFTIAITLAIVTVAVLADWAAFRLWSVVEAIVPATTLFIFTVLVGTRTPAMGSAIVFVAALAAVLFSHHQAQRAASHQWVAPAGALPVAPVALAAVVVAATVGMAAVVAPSLPGASDPPVIDLGRSSSSSQRVTVSPMVDIRGRLVEQTNQLMFTVEATQPAYWRLTSLEVFDDGIWKSSGTYVAADGRLPGVTPAPYDVATVDQRFTMVGLSAVWLPAAWQPTAVTSPSAVRWHADSATLMVDNATEDSDGLTYAVTSAVPVLDAAIAAEATGAVDPQLAATYLQLPADLTPLAARVANEVTMGATTPYAKARALQDWFQTTFTYDLNVPPGHDGDAIEAFLARRRGYCEQFAGTFAAMARTLGLPARVAVGFTPGEADPSRPGTYEVLGRHAHAWPEVWLADVGWVPFEPTPGRGAPGNETWTGQPAQQDGGFVTQPGELVPQPTTPEPGPPTNTAPDATMDPGDATDPGAGINPVAPPVTDVGTTTDSASGWLPAWAWWAVAGAVAAGTWLLLVALARSTVHRRRQGGSHASRVLAAWADVSDALAANGCARRHHETNGAFARRVAGDITDPVPDLATDLATDLAALAQWADMAAFSGTDPDGDDVATCEEVAERTVAWLQKMRTPSQRLALLVRPEPVRELVAPARNVR